MSNLVQFKDGVQNGISDTINSIKRYYKGKYMLQYLTFIACVVLFIVTMVNLKYYTMEHEMDTDWDGNITLVSRLYYYDGVFFYDDIVVRYENVITLQNAESVKKQHKDAMKQMKKLHKTIRK